jgi:condensation domain-containing protein
VSSTSRVASFLRNRREGRSVAEDTIDHHTYAAPVEVSEEQSRLWLHCAVSGCSEMYNDIFSLRYSGDLNEPAVEKAINEILSRHEAWRTSFELRDDKVVQKVTDELQVVLPVSDLRNLPAKKREAQLAKLTAQDSKRPFTLTEAPLFRARIVRMGDNDSRLTLVIHHLISDGVSVYQVFLSELQALYSSFVQGSAPNLPALPFQYSDYAEWQRRSASRGRLDAHLTYWDQQLEGELPVMKLPLDRQRAIIRKFDGGVESFRLAAEVTQGLKQLANAWDVTVFMTALSAFHVLMYHYTGECDQILGCVTSTRKQLGTEMLLGLFINMVPLRSRFSADDLYPVLVRQVRENTLMALEHDVSFDLLVRRFRRRVASITPLFQAVFVFEPSTASASEQWHVEDRSADNPFAKWDLSVILQENRGYLCGNISYCRDIFNSEAIAGMRDAWVKLLGEIAVNANRTPRQLSACLAKSKDRSSGSSWFQRYFRRT